MTPTQIQWSLAATVARGKAEILTDVQAGRVPATVADFSELHDYVDANGYGGAFEDDAPGFDAEGSITESGCDFWNEVQEQLAEWIKAGGIREACSN